MVEEGKKLTGPTIAALLTYQDETNVPILDDPNLSKRSYSILISLALSVLTSMLDTSLQTSEKEEERKRAVAAAAKVLPKLINVRPEEKERVFRHQKDFFPKMKDIFSEERNKEAKEELQEDRSISSDLRTELGLAEYIV